MEIKGDGHLVDEDPSQKTSCNSLYPPEGTDICSDVIRITLNGTTVKKLKISTGDYLTLCEVQVFGGIQFKFHFHLTYLYLIPVHDIPQCLWFVYCYRNCCYRRNDLKPPPPLNFEKSYFLTNSMFFMHKQYEIYAIYKCIHLRRNIIILRLHLLIR